MIAYKKLVKILVKKVKMMPHIFKMQIKKEG